MFLTLATMLSALSVSGHGVFGANQNVTFYQRQNSVIYGNYNGDYDYIQYGSSKSDYLSIDYKDENNNIYSLVKIYFLNTDYNPHGDRVDVVKQQLPFDINYDFTCNLSYRAWYQDGHDYVYGSETSKVMSLATGSYSTMYSYDVNVDDYGDLLQPPDGDTFFNLCLSFSYINEYDFEGRVTGAVNGNAYNSGYTDGYNSGYSHGYDEAQVDSFDDGYDRGYAQGVADTEAEGVASYTFMNLVASLADTPIVMLHGMFDFQIFGVNVLTVILSMVTALILLFVVKKLIK